MELSRSGGAVLGLALLAAPAVHAQQAAAGAGIRQFLTVPWGAGAKEVTAAYGAPLMDQSTPDSVRVMVYKDEVLGKSVLALFYLAPGQGLVKGVYTASYGDGSDCEVVFQKFQQFVQRLYPTLPAEEQRRHDDPATPFCTAAADGKAAWSVRWRDPLTDTTVQLTLEPEEQGVDLAYQSRSFRPAPGVP